MKPGARLREFRRRVVRWLMDPGRRVRLAWIQLIASLIGAPVSLLLTDEPPFILGLSWYAIAITAWDALQTADVREQQETAA